MITPTPNPPRPGASARRLLWVGVAIGGVVVAGTAILWFGGGGADDVAEQDRTSGATVTEPPTERQGLELDPQDLAGIPEATDDPTVSAPPDPTGGITRVLVVGDSVSAQIGWSLQEWSDANPNNIEVWNESHLGCGTVREGFKRVGDGSFGPVGDVCSNWAEPVPVETVADEEVVSWPTAIDVFEPDIVLIMISAWDVTDRIVPGVVDDWSSIGDPAYDSYALGEYIAATDLLTAEGATLYVLTSPVLNGASVPPDHAARIEGINRVAREAAARFPERDVRFIDYPEFIGENGSERERLMRDDGVHLSAEGFEEVGAWVAERMGLTGDDS